MIDSRYRMIVHKLYSYDPANGGVISGACLKLLDRDGKVASELHGKVGSPYLGHDSVHYCQVIGLGPFTYEVSEGVTVDFEVVETAISRVESE